MQPWVERSKESPLHPPAPQSRMRTILRDQTYKRLGDVVSASQDTLLSCNSLTHVFRTVTVKGKCDGNIQHNLSKQLFSMTLTLQHII